MSKNVLFQGQKSFLFLRKQKTKHKNKRKPRKNNKEGLGPSEVALWATSLDP